MKQAAVYTAEGRLNTKLQRQKDIVRINNQNIPDTYKSNTIKEELCLEYINSFITQFSSIYPYRKVPFLVADNEYGVKKFIGSTLRPTLLPIPELYDLYEGASFIAGFIIYEPLDPPYEPPKYLFSPQQVLESNCGDCFDIANLLCSFLLGAGYDAYVVHGYAPKYITLKDQSNTICPMISNSSHMKDDLFSLAMQSDDPTAPGAGAGITAAAAASPAKKADHHHNHNKTEKAENNGMNSNYIPPDNSVKSSRYLHELQEKKRLEAIDSFVLFVDDPDLQEPIMMEEEKKKYADVFRSQMVEPHILANKPKSAYKKVRKVVQQAQDANADYSFGRTGSTGFATSGSASLKADKAAQEKEQHLRPHAWVLIRSGRRDVKNTVFIEPSTGRVYDALSGSSGTAGTVSGSGGSKHPYLGIEAIYNHLNYYVYTGYNHLPSTILTSNPATATSTTSSTNPTVNNGWLGMVMPSDYAFASSNWEALFLGDQSSNASNMVLNSDGTTSLINNNNNNNNNGEDSNNNSNNNRPESDNNNNNNNNTNNNNNNNDNNNNNNTTSADDSNTLLRYLDAPPAWSIPLTLSRTRFLLKYPPEGRRTIQYHCAKADFYAKRSILLQNHTANNTANNNNNHTNNTHNNHNMNQNHQSMLMRITTYLDPACTRVKGIYEWYDNNRLDKLTKRIRLYIPHRKIIAFYAPGSKDEVKRWCEIPGKRLEIEYYVEGRLDRLYRRSELLGQKVIEFFDGRTDLLIYRETLLTTDRSRNNNPSGTQATTAGGGPRVGTTTSSLPSTAGGLPQPPTTAAGTISLPPNSAVLPNIRQFLIPRQNNLGVDVYVMQMIQEYAKNPSIQDGSDIYRRTFYVQEGKAIFAYHFAHRQITGRVRTMLHTRGGGASMVIPSLSEAALAQEVGLDDTPEALMEAAQYERECFSSLKLAFQMHDKLVESLLTGEQYVQTNGGTVFDQALDKVELLANAQLAAANAAGATGQAGYYSWMAGPGAGGDGEAGYPGTGASSGKANDAGATAGKGAGNSGADYLTPFLKNVHDPTALSREEALMIRQSCLDALKARLVERAAIIQNKLHEENAKLAKRQELFQRSQREGDYSTEDYEKYCTEAMFRIQILEQRLTAHEDAAPNKYAALDAKLSTDPRLRILKT